MSIVPSKAVPVAQLRLAAVSAANWEFWKHVRIGEVQAFCLLDVLCIAIVAKLFRQLAHRDNLDG